MELNIWVILLFAGLSLAAASLSMFLARHLVPIDTARERKIVRAYSGLTRRYIFREGYLLSEIDPNDAFLDHDLDRSRAYEDLSLSLASLSEDVAAKLAALACRGDPFRTTCFLGEDALTLSGHKHRDTLQITVAPAEAGAGREAVDSAVLNALNAEVEDLRDAIDHNPVLVWKQDDQGAISWANAAYFDLLTGEESDSAAMTWPIPHLFEASALRTLPAGEGRRLSIHPCNSQTVRTFEISFFRRPDRSMIFMALPIDRLLAAEEALGNLVQTLSKTFAQLPIGLAVFDGKRELVLFNPALTMLSTLGAQFLSGRPTLIEFLDALRDRHRVPEPKNYRDWRNEIARIERCAEEDGYQEFWTLPGGESWRVIGRPHPDGGVAFMFEDISSEVSLTRKFRGDLDLHQSVFDAIPAAFAVFSADGALVVHNVACQEMWGLSKSATSEAVDLVTAWLDMAAPGPTLEALQRVSSGHSKREQWAATLELADGTALICRVAPLAGGFHMVQFDDDDPRSGLLQALSPGHEEDATSYEVAESASDFAPAAFAQDVPRQGAG